MPELPEVESIRLGLKKVLSGNTILKVTIHKPKLVSSNSNIRIPNKLKVNEFQTEIKNKKINNVSRRAKNILIHLEDDSLLVIHLKMTGQLVFTPTSPQEKITIGGHPIEESFKSQLPNKHSHIIFELDNGTLYYNDIRQFGYVLYFSNLSKAIEAGHFASLGMEPLSPEFTLEYFKSKISKLNKSIKEVLLDQKVVVGCGNIYADEICFASQVLPTRKCNSLNEKEIELIYQNIKLILTDAIAHGGSSISDYLLADGSRGNYARKHQVYGRAKLPCKVCGNTLSKIIIGGRATVFCPACQK
jgi:formamidopyrimidine-DNA glycosylase